MPELLGTALVQSSFKTFLNLLHYFELCLWLSKDSHFSLCSVFPNPFLNDAFFLFLFLGEYHHSSSAGLAFLGTIALIVLLPNTALWGSGFSFAYTPVSNKKP